MVIKTLLEIFATGLQRGAEQGEGFVGGGQRLFEFAAVEKGFPGAGPEGVVRVSISASMPFSDLSSMFSIVRAGEILFGSSAPDPIRGWTAPTYGVKIPALSLALDLIGRTEISFSTVFSFPSTNR